MMRLPLVARSATAAATTLPRLSVAYSSAAQRYAEDASDVNEGTETPAQEAERKAQGNDTFSFSFFLFIFALFFSFSVILFFRSHVFIFARS